MPRVSRKGSLKELPPDAGDPAGFTSLAALFVEWLRCRNYSPATITGRRHYLDFFARWCFDRGLLHPHEITKAVLERYRRFLFHYRTRRGGVLSFRSQAGYLHPVKSFFKWLCRENHIPYNPASELELPKPEHRLPKCILTAAEAETVINQADVNSPLGIRDRAILETLYSTGMRRMELVRLQLCDVDRDRGTVMIRQGKGKKDRMIPIGDRALFWIDRYAGQVRPTLARHDDSTLFITDRHEKFCPDHMTLLVRQYIDSAQIGKRGSCHLFRHTMATLMLENGADVRFVQEMLGHSLLNTTQIYTQVSIRKLKEVHAATHPARMIRQDAAAPEAT